MAQDGRPSTPRRSPWAVASARRSATRSARTACCASSPRARPSCCRRCTAPGLPWPTRPGPRRRPRPPGAGQRLRHPAAEPRLRRPLRRARRVRRTGDRREALAGAPARRRVAAARPAVDRPPGCRAPRPPRSAGVDAVLRPRRLPLRAARLAALGDRARRHEHPPHDGRARLDPSPARRRPAPGGRPRPRRRPGACAPRSSSGVDPLDPQATAGLLPRHPCRRRRRPRAR